VEGSPRREKTILVTNSIVRHAGRLLIILTCLIPAFNLCPVSRHIHVCNNSKACFPTTLGKIWATANPSSMAGSGTVLREPSVPNLFQCVGKQLLNCANMNMPTNGHRLKAGMQASQIINNRPAWRTIEFVTKNCLFSAGCLPHAPMFFNPRIISDVLTHDLTKKAEWQCLSSLIGHNYCTSIPGDSLKPDRFTVVLHMKFLL